MLRHCPNLKVLDIRVSDFNRDAEYDPVCLEKLEKLTYTGYTGTWLRLVKAPSLQSLTVEGTAHFVVNEVVALFTDPSHKPHLRILRLTLNNRIPMDEEEEPSLLRALPDVVDLSLRTNCSESMIDLLSFAPDRDRPCPLLETLDLKFELNDSSAVALERMLSSRFRERNNFSATVEPVTSSADIIEIRSKIQNFRATGELKRWIAEGRLTIG